MGRKSGYLSTVEITATVKFMKFQLIFLYKTCLSTLYMGHYE
jgi:hypothetical protein